MMLGSKSIEDIPDMLEQKILDVRESEEEEDDELPDTLNEEKADQGIKDFDLLESPQKSPQVNKIRNSKELEFDVSPLQ